MIDSLIVEFGWQN